MRHASSTFGSLPYAVIDVETTGLAPLNSRIVEIAIVRLEADGTERQTFSTILYQDSGPGPTHIHGLTAGDLAGAPTFRDIADLIDGAVIVAHNTMFDTSMLVTEFNRLGAAPDNMLTLCTLNLARQFRGDQRSLRLIDCAEAEGIPLTRMHTAAHDAQATAQLLLRYLQRAQ